MTGRPITQKAGHGSGAALHVMSPRQLLTIFVLLIILTAVTVVAAGIALGAVEIWVALGIATVKAALVATYFMHLRYDAPLNAAIFVFSLAFVALFLGLTLVDVKEYQPDVLPPTVEHNQ